MLSPESAWQYACTRAAQESDISSSSILHANTVFLLFVPAAVSHFVAYETDEMMVDDPGAIAVNYRWGSTAATGSQQQQQHVDLDSLFEPLK